MISDNGRFNLIDYPDIVIQTPWGEARINWGEGMITAPNAQALDYARTMLENSLNVIAKDMGVKDAS